MASTNMLFFKYVGDGESILLNNAPTNPGKTYLLGNGSVIKNSKISPIYFSNISNRFILDEQKARIEFCADNIEFHYPNSKNGIQKFSFFEESGNLIGIMGGSGVGKSTLLNLLIGNYSLATAAGMFKTVIAVALVFSANAIANRLGENSLM